MNVVIDLGGLSTTEQVLRKLGEVFELGGPKGNHPVRPGERRGWGMCWDALEDCLHELEDGGIWGRSRRFAFPLTIVIQNHESFERADPPGFENFKDILQGQVQWYAEANKQLTVTFA